MDMKYHSLKSVIADLFSSLEKQPMTTQVAVIDALEDFVLDWLVRHDLSCVPVKQWKCSFEEAFQLQCVSDWLPVLAAVFAESHLMRQIHVYITEQHDASVVECSDRVEDGCVKTETKSLTLCTGVRDTAVSSVSNESNAEGPTTQDCKHPSTDVDLVAASQPECIDDNTVDNGEDMSLTDSDALNTDMSSVRKTKTSRSACQRKRSCQKSVSAMKQACSRRQSRKSKAVLSETSTTDNSKSAGDDVCGPSLQTDMTTASSTSVEESLPPTRPTQRKRSSKRSASKQPSGVSSSERSKTDASSSSRDELMNGLTVCEICGAVVKCLKSHLLKHGEPKHKCRYCSFATRQLQSLRIHEHRIHTNYRPHLCEACGKSFVMSTLLKEHINEKHGSLKRERRYQCSSCSYTAYTRSILQRHEVKHTPCRRPEHRCDVCGARLMTIYSLNEHKRLSHVEDRPFPCAICGFKAKSVKRLRSHMRCHGEKSFACDLCTKKFTMRAQLVRHQLVHSGVKAFVCPFCAYRSAIIENLRKHCHAVHKVLYPPKKRDVARSSDDFSVAAGSTTGCTTVQGCSTLTDYTTSTLEGCTMTTVTALPVLTSVGEGVHS